MYKIEENITIEQIKALKPKMIFYGARTCWWTHNLEHLGNTKPDSTGLPCDPIGGVLFQTEDMEGWFKAAEAGQAHYGKFGLKAFIAAHHQNCFHSVDTLNGRGQPETEWKPWALETWKAYEAVLFMQEANKPNNENQLAIKKLSDLLSDKALQAANTLKIEQVEIYRDGGTRQITTNQGVFFISRPHEGTKVFDNWPKTGNRIPEFDEILPKLADAFSDGQHEMGTRLYSDWDVRIIAEDFAKEQMGVVTTTRFRDWFKTHPKNKLNQQ